MLTRIDGFADIHLVEGHDYESQMHSQRVEGQLKNIFKK